MAYILLVNHILNLSPKSNNDREIGYYTDNPMTLVSRLLLIQEVS